MLTLRNHDIMIFRGINDKLLQKIYCLKNANKTCKPNNCDLNRDWKREYKRVSNVFRKTLLRRVQNAINF